MRIVVTNQKIQTDREMKAHTQKNNKPHNNPVSF